MVMLGRTSFESGTINSFFDEAGLPYEWQIQTGNTAEISTERAHSGVRSLKLVKNDPEGSRLKPIFYNYGRNEYYQEMWIYIKSLNTGYGWGGLMSSIRSYEGLNWYTGLQLLAYGNGGVPYWDFRHAHTSGDSDPQWRMFSYADRVSVEVPSKGVMRAQPHPVPIGRWFKITQYWYLDQTNGIYKVWITDPASGADHKLLFSLEGDITWHTGETKNLQPMYQYGMNSTIFYDELAMFDGMPDTQPPTPEPPPIILPPTITSINVSPNPADVNAPVTHKAVVISDEPAVVSWYATDTTGTWKIGEGETFVHSYPNANERNIYAVAANSGGDSLPSYTVNLTFNTEPPPPPEPEPEPEPEPQPPKQYELSPLHALIFRNTETVAYQCCQRLRNKLISEDLHNKLHPLV